MSDATSVDATPVLFGLDEEFSRERPCPDCRVFTGTVKDGLVKHSNDVPASADRAVVPETSAVCSEPPCVSGRPSSARYRCAAQGPVTERLRQQLATRNRAGCDVAAEYGCPGRPPLVAAATRWLPEPEPAFGDAIEIVVMDRSTPYATGIRLVRS
jgi:hypothetical protein